MDFFQHQDTARRNTRWLVFFFFLAIACLILITTAAVVITYYFTQFNSVSAVNAVEGNFGIFSAAFDLITWEIFLSISIAVLVVVALGCIYKFTQLSSGGKRVAESLGGRRLMSDSRDPDERKILNVVEEMAIASGTPVPPVYLMDDESINAFAAGFKPQDAVIGITRGCIKLLNREQLQGVIAHEFSHILHGDMRLNIRLIGVLHGILSLGLIGSFIFRSSAYSGIGRSRRNNGGMFIFLGLALIVVGYAGTFFGNIIKAAVSRQREFLADSSAVQFTRNPEGISGALKKISGYPMGSLISSPTATEFSHMYFGQGIVTHFSNLMATHPPLKERILRIEPNWKGPFAPVSFSANVNETEEGVSHFQSGTSTTTVDNSNNLDEAFDMADSKNPQSAIESIGQPSPAHLSYAHRLMEELDNTLRDAAHNPFSARAFIYCVLLDRHSNSTKQVQMDLLQQQADKTVFRYVQQIESNVSNLPAENILPIVDICMPSLKLLSDQQFVIFKKNVVDLIRADNKVNLFEWSLYRILIHNLEEQASVSAKYNLKSCAEECRVLLSMIAHAGHTQVELSRSAFQDSFKTLGIGSRFFIASSDISLNELDKAIEKLRGLKPLQKPALLKAIAQCINYDQKITALEKELFRAIADSLDCPVPPILNNQTLA